MFHYLVNFKASFEGYILQSVSRIWASKISLWWFGFKLKLTFTTAPAGSKNDNQFKRSPIRLKNNQLTLLIKTL